MITLDHSIAQGPFDGEANQLVLMMFNLVLYARSGMQQMPLGRRES